VHLHHRILIVEDDILQAMDLEIALQDSGYDVVGIAMTNTWAFLLIDEVSPDFAILDYHLAQSTSIPVAVKLRDQQIPFVYVTGQVENLLTDATAPTARTFQKPYIQSELLQFIGGQIGRPDFEAIKA